MWNDRCGRALSTLGHATPGRWSWILYMQAEQASHEEQVGGRRSSTVAAAVSPPPPPPRHLFRTDRSLEADINPFSPRLLLVTIFITATESKLSCWFLLH